MCTALSLRVSVIFSVVTFNIEGLLRKNTLENS